MLRSVLTRIAARLRLGSGAPGAGQASRQFGKILRAADALRDGHDYGAAAAAYAQAFTLRPDRTDLRVQMGNMLKDSGAYVEAEAAYRAALAAEPHDDDIYLQLAHTLKRQGRRAEAMTAYRRAVTLNPACAEAVGELAAAGEAGAQLAAFEAQLRGHGAEALMQISAELSAMRQRLDQIGAALPEPAGWAAFPVTQYGVFRALFDVPPPPACSMRIAVTIEADLQPLSVLYQQLAALQAQSHADWRLFVHTNQPAQQEIVARAAATDARILWPPARPADGQDVPWRLALGQGAIPHPHALGWIAYAASRGPVEAFIFDEAIVSFDGDRMAFVAVELRSTPDREAAGQAQLWMDTLAMRADVALSPAELLRRGGVGHIPLPLVSRDAAARPMPAAPPQRAIGTVGAETMAVIIPTRDSAEDVAVMAESLRRLANQPEQLSIIVIATAGASPATQARLAALADARMAMRRAEAPFNWSLVNNQAIADSTADIVVCANDDMRMLTPGWDDRLRSLLARPEIGAIGVKLLYEDNTIQHAGILLGWRGGTIHDGLYEPADAPGPVQRWQITREVGAVTGAFLATRREVFLAMGGFDAQDLPIGFSDVDYALKLRAAGLKVLWTPDISLYHHESKTRGLDHLDPSRQARDAAERAVMRARWGEAMDFDPGVNPYWHDASLPFRLIAAVSLAKLNRYITASASGNPWSVKRQA